MKVSILMITYNHEKFIAQAIESVVTQEVNFDYELVIGEDCSLDRTRDIVIEFQQKYPTKIRALLPEKNLGGKGVNNFVTTFHACKGQYIAVLEGDDYWTSRHKLQKQVDFLDSHPDYAICFHNVRGFYEDGSQKQRNLCPDNQKETSTLEELLAFNFISTCSVMFRRGLVSEFPEWYYTLKMGDWPLHILNAQYGKIGYINEVMGAYRMHRGGEWSYKSGLYHLYAMLEAYEHINAHLGFRYDRIIKASIGKHYLALAATYADCGDLATAKRYLSKSLAECPFNPRIRLLDLLVVLGRLYIPPLYKLLKLSWTQAQSYVPRDGTIQMKRQDADNLSLPTRLSSRVFRKT